MEIKLVVIQDRLSMHAMRQTEASHGIECKCRFSKSQSSIAFLCLAGTFTETDTHTHTQSTKINSPLLNNSAQGI